MDSETLFAELSKLGNNVEALETIKYASNDKLEELLSSVDSYEEYLRQAKEIPDVTIRNFYNEISGDVDSFVSQMTCSLLSNATLETAYQTTIKLPMILDWLPAGEASRVENLVMRIVSHTLIVFILKKR